MRMAGQISMIFEILKLSSGQNDARIALSLQWFQADETICQRISRRDVYFKDEDRRGIHDGFDASQHRSRLPAYGVPDYSGPRWRQ